MASLDPFLAVASLAFVIVAGLVHGTLGLGFPLVATPLLTLVTDVRAAVLMTLLPTVTVNVSSILRGGDWRASIGRFWPLALCALLGGLFGTHLLVVNDPEPFRVALAGLVLLYLVASRGGGLRLPWLGSHPTASMLGVGLVAGVAAGSTNVMVPILIIYALELDLERKVQVQTFNLCFLAGKLSQMGVFASTGALTGAVLLWTAPLALAAWVALRFGERVRDRIDAATYRRWLRWLLGVLAVVLIGQFLFR